MSKRLPFLLSHPEHCNPGDILPLHGCNVYAGDYENINVISRILLGQTSMAMPKAKAAKMAVVAAARTLFEFRTRLNDEREAKKALKKL